jgi:myb proto-oncogene protein
VKNRFSTLCKKRAKYEALAKENASSYINPNNKRVLSQNVFNSDGTSEIAAPIKKMRYSEVE